MVREKTTPTRVEHANPPPSPKRPYSPCTMRPAMEYHEAVKKILDSAGAAPGDTIEVAGDGWSHRGVVMPHHSFSGDDILTLKLPNGYNVGIKAGNIKQLTMVAKAEPAVRATRQISSQGGKPTIAFLGTGGTIASYVDYRTGAVHPAVTIDEVVFSVPELLDLCNVRGKAVFSMYSENMLPGHWSRIAEEAARELNEGAHAVVVPHGTDTLHYTAAALSFMLKNLTGPVMVVGSQRSSDRPSSDAAMNLLCTARLADANLGEVVVVMHGETSDEYCLIHRGTKVRKMHSSRRDAFRSMNQIPLGKVSMNDGVELSPIAKPRAHGTVSVDSKWDDNVSLVQFHLGLKPETLQGIVDKSDGLVVAGTGLGHVASNLIPVLRRAVDASKPVVVTTQCLSGRVGLTVYDTGRDMIGAGVIPGEDMLPEVALVKLMWVLGHTRDMKEVSRLMRTDTAGEINPAISLQEYEAE